MFYLLGQSIIFDIIFYAQIAVVLGLCVLLLISLSNLRYLRRLHEYKPPQTWPRVSVLVPARNEEDNIGKCVSCLLAQDYADYQLIVLDDNSTDRTWEILQGFASKDARLKLIKGKPLPDDWLGKHWACQQLSEAADGELLLFIDADTLHEPDMLRCTASAMEGEKAALISVLPHQIVITWSEMLSIPAFYMGMLCGVPIGLTRLQTNPLLFACLGQFLIFKRDAYLASGGYAAVRQNVVDDLAIGRRINAMRLRYCLLDGYKHISCRMYTNYDQVWKGLTKSTFATFNFDPFFIIFMYLQVIVIFLSPLAVLIAALFVPGFPLQATIMAGIAVVLAMLLWILNNVRFHFPLYLVLTYPASVIFMTIIAMASMVLTIQGKAKWKDRLMPKFVKL
jgi:chlorobactene glucosyltransferase